MVDFKKNASSYPNKWAGGAGSCLGSESKVSHIIYIAFSCK